MSFLPRLTSLHRNLLRKREVEDALDVEVRSYLDLLTQEKIAAGMSPEEAERAARIELGGEEQVKESVRDIRVGATLESIGRDLRHTVRMLMKRPGFALVAILTLAIGIGANTAIFSVVHAVLLKPLPYPDADRLEIVWSTFGKETRAPASGPEFVYLSERSRLFEEFGGIWVTSGALTGDGEPEQVKMGLVTANCLSLLTKKPQIGRLFQSAEQGRGANPVVILSDGVWRRRYGASAEILGRAIRVNGQALTVVGVLPADFQILFPDGSNVPTDIQVFSPFPFDLAKGQRDMGYIRILGRMKEGTSVKSAQAELDGIAGQLRGEFTEFGSQNLGLTVIPLQGDVVRNVRPALLVLTAGVGLVLLIACANVANLLLARATERQREITLRTALGAGSGRIVRQLLTESVFLSCLGGIAALVVGKWAVGWFLSLQPEGITRLGVVELNFAVLAFTLAVSVAAGVLFGLAPALQATKLNLSEALKEGGRTNSSGKHRSRSLLVASEVALGSVLLIGAGLMMQTFRELVRVNPGFESKNVLTFQVSLPGIRYRQDVDRVNFARELEKGISSLPGVTAVGLSSHVPFDDGLPNWYSYYWKEGANEEEQNTLMADHRGVRPGYFPSLGAQFMEGRNFDEFDETSGRRTVIVDETIAQQMWPGERAAGKKLNIEIIQNGNFIREWAEVVGVVKHLQYHSLTSKLRGQVYLPYSLAPRPQVTFTVRSTDSPQVLVGGIRGQVAQLDKDLPAAKFRLLDEYVEKARAETRFTSMLASSMAGIALLLACIGVYSVTACAVAQRTSEIGVRIALGAGRGEILKMVLRQGMTPVIFGSVAGVGLSLAVTPLYSRLLFGVRPIDAATFATVFLLLAAAGLVACTVPARRAMRMDPSSALRFE